MVFIFVGFVLGDLGGWFGGGDGVTNRSPVVKTQKKNEEGRGKEKEDENSPS